MSESVQHSTALPSEDVLRKREPQEQPEIGEGEQPTKKYKFADEIVIDGKTVLNISADKMFYSEPTIQREKKTRWSDPIHRKSSYQLTQKPKSAISISIQSRA